MVMKDTEKVPFDSMPPLIKGSFLTKEQAKKLKEPFKDVVSIVRCKDCIHYRYYGLSVETVSECRIDHCENPDADWFCADGERAE